MKKIIPYIFFLLATIPVGLQAQNILPEISVKSLNGRVVVSWLNNYSKRLENIVIQRSFDSLGNFKSIGSVLNPQNLENGYPDQNPPYNKMYYRVFIYFENGEYICGPAYKAVSENPTYQPIDFTDVPEPIEDTPIVIKPIEEKIIPETTIEKIPEKPDSTEVIEDNQMLTSRKIKNIEVKKEYSKKNISIIDSIKTIQLSKSIGYSFPSTRIFSSRLNNLVIQLPDFLTKKYLIRFYDDLNNFLFEIKKITDDFLILEKSNFLHSGWYYFEIIEDGKLIEKNKFYISKDSKLNK